MNIIFGKDQAEQLKDRYTVLELDTVKYQVDGPGVTAYCIVDTIPLMELPSVESMSELHDNLMKNYRARDWNYCLQAIDHLYGQWGNELDSFYDILRSRITKFQDNDPGANWDPTILKRTT